MTAPISDPVLVFAMMLLVALVAPLLMRRARLPGVIGVILAGIAIGPNGLNLLELGDTAILFGTVGLLYIMFLAGMEIDLHQFERQRHRSVVFGALTFLFPQILGTLLFVWMGFSWPAAILIASMFASHTLVAYPIIGRLGLMRNDAVVTTVGGTILTDTAALLVLAVVAASVEGDLGPMFWVRLGGLLALYVAVMVFLLPRLGRWFFRNVEDQPAEFLFVLASAFLFAYLARVIGIEPIVGAFFAGLVLNRLVPASSPLMNRLVFVGDALFIPFFLLYIGMLVDVGLLLRSPAAWGVMFAMLGATMVTKFIASKLTQRIFGYSSAEGWVIFGLSTTQAAATLAATLVGYRIGLIGDDVLNGAILMILGTCLIGPWMVERYGRKAALEASERPYDRATAPQRILVPLANPERAPRLVEVALAIRRNDEPLFPLTVTPGGHEMEARVADAEKLLASAVEHAAAAAVPARPITRVDPNIANGLARAIAENRITDVVTGWDGGRPAGPRIFGSVLDQFLEQTAQQVLVCKIERPLATHERMLLAVPPLAEREYGFEPLAGTLKRLANQATAEIVLIAEEGQRAALLDPIKVVRPDVPISFRSMNEWRELDEHLQLLVQPADLIVVLSARRGTLSWRSGLDRLPRIVADHFPDSSLIVAYPGSRLEPGAPPVQLRYEGFGSFHPRTHLEAVEPPQRTVPDSETAQS